MISFDMQPRQTQTVPYNKQVQMHTSTLHVLLAHPPDSYQSSDLSITIPMQMLINMPIHLHNTVWGPIILCAYHIKRKPCFPPEQLQGHTHLSQNKARDIPPNNPNIQILFFCLPLLQNKQLQKNSQGSARSYKLKNNYKYTEWFKCYYMEL